MVATDVAPSLEEAARRLAEDPSTPVVARSGRQLVELHVVAEVPAPQSASDAFAEIGPWEGESGDEIADILREARRAGGQRSVGGL